MSSISINLDLIESTMDTLSNQMEKSSIKNENEYGFKTPPRKMIQNPIKPPSIKMQYYHARLKRSRSVLINLNDLGNESDDERESPKVLRSKFPNLNSE